MQHPAAVRPDGDAIGRVRGLVARHAAGHRLTAVEARMLIDAARTLQASGGAPAPMAFRAELQAAVRDAHALLDTPPAAPPPPDSPVAGWPADYARSRLAAFRSVDPRAVRDPAHPQHAAARQAVGDDLAELAIAYHDPQHPDHAAARADVAAAHWVAAGDRANDNGLANADTLLSVRSTGP